MGWELDQDIYRYAANCTLPETGTRVKSNIFNRGWKLNSSSKCQGRKIQMKSTPLMHLITSSLGALTVDDGELPGHKEEEEEL